MANSSLRDFQKFNSFSSIFGPNPLIVDYLVVAGGGAGGGSQASNTAGGGGGAGGYRTSNGSSGGGNGAEASVTSLTIGSVLL